MRQNVKHKDQLLFILFTCSIFIQNTFLLFSYKYGVNGLETQAKKEKRDRDRDREIDVSAVLCQRSDNSILCSFTHS